MRGGGVSWVVATENMTVARRISAETSDAGTT